MLPDRIK